MSEQVNTPKVIEFLSDENENRLYRDVIDLLTAYVDKYPKNVAAINGHIAYLTNTAVQRLNERRHDAVSGIESCIAIWSLKDKDVSDSFYVCASIRSIMQMFPAATAEYGSQVMVDYFDEFVQRLKGCKDELVDSDWAVNIIKCNDYLKKVLENN